MNNRTLLGIGCLLIGLQSALAQETKTVLPSGFANVPGNVPDTIFLGGELQQVFRGSALAPIIPNPIQITGVAFRVFGSIFDFRSTLGRVEIRLSSTSKNPETMGRFWDNNKGPDATVVFLHNDVPVNASGTMAINPFEIQFRFDRPFEYDAINGSLLMYIRTDGSSPAMTIDAQDFEAIDSLRTSPVGFAHISDPVVSARGLITEFTWISVPEPTTLPLAILGSAALLFTRKKHRA